MKWIMPIILVCIVFPTVSASVFDLFSPKYPPGVAPGAVCGIMGCTMKGNIDMNYSYILNAYMQNVTFLDIIYVNATQVNNPIWVNKTGDTMSGNLDMGGNDILNVDKIEVGDWSNVTITESQITDLTPHRAGGAPYLINDSTAIYLDETPLNATISDKIILEAPSAVGDHWVNESGDKMTGDLNMTNNSIWNVNILQVHNITGASPVYISSNVIVVPGVYYYGSGRYLTDINTTAYSAYANSSIYAENATFAETSAYSLFSLDTAADRWVNETGDSMTGPLNMTGNDITNVGTIDAVYYLNLPVYDGDGRWIYRNGYIFYLNESLLNSTMDERDSDWCANGSCPYLNVSGVIIENGTIWLTALNVSIINAINITAQYLDVIVLWADIVNATNITVENIEASQLITNTFVVNGSIEGLCLSNGTGCQVQNGTIYYNGTGLLLNNNIFSVDETYLNNTILSLTGIFEENVTISVSGGVGTGTTVNCCNGANEILQIAVFPTTTTNKYRFSANTSVTGEIVDSDRALHTGDWQVAHRGSVVINENINYYVTNAQTDENFTIRVRYEK